MSPLPQWLEPMAATLTQERFTGPDWIFERKLDGIRLLAYRDAAGVRLYSRTRREHSHAPVSEAIAQLPVTDIILDGEATAGWERLPDDYHVFDILWLNGRDLTQLPWWARRELLEQLPFRSPIALVQQLADEEPWERACAEGWEGVIAKRRVSIYEVRRSRSWLKM